MGFLSQVIAESRRPVTPASDALGSATPATETMADTLPAPSIPMGHPQASDAPQDPGVFRQDEVNPSSTDQPSSVVLSSYHAEGQLDGSIVADASAVSPIPAGLSHPDGVQQDPGLSSQDEVKPSSADQPSSAVSRSYYAETQQGDAITDADLGKTHSHPPQTEFPTKHIDSDKNEAGQGRPQPGKRGEKADANDAAINSGGEVVPPQASDFRSVEDRAGRHLSPRGSDDKNDLPQTRPSTNRETGLGQAEPEQGTPASDIRSHTKQQTEQQPKARYQAGPAEEQRQRPTSSPVNHTGADESGTATTAGSSSVISSYGNLYQPTVSAGDTTAKVNKPPQVRIGQVNVIVEGPPQGKERRSSSKRPHDSGSRLFLRGV